MTTAGPAALVRMAGQIADFFRPYPEEQAVAAIAGHINQFWNRHMRAELLAAFSSGAPPRDSLLAKALPRIKVPARRE